MTAMLIPAILLIGSTVVGADPASTINHARGLLAAGNCAGAAAALQSARPSAAALEDERTRTDAMAALLFYSAQAHTRCGSDRAAREELKEFFRLRPGHSALDESKFDRRFVTLFADVQKDVELGAGVSFERFYPGFSNASPAAGGVRPLNLWGASSEFQLLATREERDRWGRLRTDVERTEFVTDFWRVRDTNAETEQNEFETEITRRVGFAEQTFPSMDERGALTDRGRVFVLLGPPSRIHRQALQRGQTTFVRRSVRRPLEGQIERWIYFRAQLPGSVPAQQVEFRFITQPGYGEAVMEKDFMALKALEQALKASTAHFE